MSGKKNFFSDFIDNIKQDMAKSDDMKVIFYFSNVLDALAQYVLYVSFRLRMKPNILGCVCMSSVVLFVCILSLVLYLSLQDQDCKMYKSFWLSWVWGCLTCPIMDAVHVCFFTSLCVAVGLSDCDVSCIFYELCPFRSRCVWGVCVLIQYYALFNVSE